MHKIDELKKAQQALDQAQQNFELADQDHIDAAINQLRAAERKLETTLQKIRGDKNLVSLEIQQHLEKLKSYLQSNSLNFESRRWVINEIWEMKIATSAKAARFVS